MDDALQHTNTQGSKASIAKDGVNYEERDAHSVRVGESSSSSAQRDGRVAGEGAHETPEGGRRWWKRGQRGTYSHTHFKVYKRRWFGLAQLVLLNIVVSWDVSRCAVSYISPRSPRLIIICSG